MPGKMARRQLQNARENVAKALDLAAQADDTAYNFVREPSQAAIHDLAQAVRRLAGTTSFLLETLAKLASAKAEGA